MEKIYSFRQMVDLFAELGIKWIGSEKLHQCGERIIMLMRELQDLELEEITVAHLAGNLRFVNHVQGMISVSASFAEEEVYPLLSLGMVYLEETVSLMQQTEVVVRGFLVPVTASKARLVNSYGMYQETMMELFLELDLHRL